MYVEKHATTQIVSLNFDDFVQREYSIQWNVHKEVMEMQMQHIMVELSVKENKNTLEKC